jgi:hypothetical protein
MSLKLDPCVSCTHLKVHNTCLRTLFYKDHSAETCMFAIVNTFIIKRIHKLVAK